jgi:hypothetical protein
LKYNYIQWKDRFISLELKFWEMYTPRKQPRYWLTWTMMRHQTFSSFQNIPSYLLEVNPPHLHSSNDQG